MVGVYVAARAVRAIRGGRVENDELWPGWMTRGLVAVALLEGIVLSGWLAGAGRPSLAGEAALLAAFALAMGAQGALVHRLGLSGVTTTFVTGTLTRFLSELATAVRGPPRRPRVWSPVATLTPPWWGQCRKRGGWFGSS